MSTEEARSDEWLRRQSLLLEVTEFFTRDACLLDEWRLNEWLGTFTDECDYVVPAPGLPGADPHSDLLMVSDDRFLLEHRVEGLLNGTAWAESPRSRTHRMISNVRCSENADGTISASAHFLVTRARGTEMSQFPGTFHLTLVRTAQGLKMRKRQAVLALERLSPPARITIIL